MSIGPSLIADLSTGIVRVTDERSREQTDEHETIGAFTDRLKICMIIWL